MKIISELGFIRKRSCTSYATPVLYPLFFNVFSKKPGLSKVTITVQDSYSSCTGFIFPDGTFFRLPLCL